MCIDDLKITTLNPVGVKNASLPQGVATTSVLGRLVRLALDIFDGVCQSPAFHPARDFQAIIHSVFSLIMRPIDTDVPPSEEIEFGAMQSLLDLMNESGLEWPGNLLDLGADYTANWDMNGDMNMR